MIKPPKATQNNMCVLDQLACTFLCNLSKNKHKIWLAFYLLFIAKYWIFQVHVNILLNT